MLYLETMRIISFFIVELVISTTVIAFPDWLIENINIESRLRKLPNDVLELTNGLISRRFTLKVSHFQFDFISID